MGQSAPTPSPRTQRPARLTPQKRRQQLKQQEMQKPLQAVEQVRHRQPTLKEQWQAQREANAAAREAKAMERKRKKEAFHAALMAQQKQAEDEQENVDDVDDGAHLGGGSSDGDDECLQNAEEEAMLAQARINAQLAAFQTFMQNNPDLEEDLDSVDANPANMFDCEAMTTAALQVAKHGGCTGGSGGLGDRDDDEAIANVSVHSSDYADEELMRGLDDLDEELEQEFLNRIDLLEQQVAEHKQQSLVYLREHKDKAVALQELQKAKQIEAQIKQLLDEHETPLRVQIEEQQTKIVELENLVATSKQQSLATLRGGDKPSALTLLKEARGFESQLEAVKKTLATLQKEKEKQLRSKGEN
ncbi:hypothetical protein, unknown function [Leishmania mexicana MHOM/GT/2001/U1103]|uniref:Uncharacterized protein n=1 Tax=Leishmania mexicana (strain MHOM/GT/2001/U1103) TaxID=929439 RepID=E9AUL8_LEIMU|nr:hypothetical protein, unknown function [Leishmania mexicana MHOM/GT/2001/U1103]CBZ26647.1 hypothetical protein, unknown function [Leishmania mexicana MHOM/GT/2001/U1103]